MSSAPKLPNTPQLITYADRLAGSLDGIRRLLDGPLDGAFTGVHVLPFFVPIDGADAGFDPSDHTEVDPRIGTWDDIEALSKGRHVMADLVVNHVSDDSEPFLDWLAHGEQSAAHGMFLTYDAVFPTGASESDLTSIYRPRPGLPFSRIRLADGTVRLLWTTFTTHQIDIDVEHPSGWQYLLTILDRFADAGVSMVRLDAVGYAIKRAGTSCFMLPETLEFVDRLAGELHDRGIVVLVEVHGHHLMQLEIAQHVDLVYDFALPPLLLDAMEHGDALPLRRWLAIRPANAVNVLDTHDGIGIIDVGADPTNPDREGLLPPDRLLALVDAIHERTGGTSRLATGAAASNLDLYQVNSTYYDAMGRDDDWYLLARLVQCLVPGIPQVYYVGLLAGTNDVELLERSGVGRDINRHHYLPDEVDEALTRPVVRALLALLRWRSTYPAFEGTSSVVDAPDHVLRLRWEHRAASAAWSVDASIDLAAATVEIVETGPAGTRHVSAVGDL